MDLRKQNYISFFSKLLWALAPLAWGAFSFFMDFGYISKRFPHGYLGSGISNLIKFGLPILVILWFFNSAFKNAAKNYQLKFFDYDFTIPNYLWFILLAFIAIGFTFTPMSSNLIMGSLIWGVTLSPIIEEFVARGFFVKYKMGLWEFIFFNFISSLAFTYMHSFYFKEITVLQLCQNMHFPFSFMLGIIVYKTQRIEISILLHMLSNLMRYTIPTVIFAAPYPSPLFIISSNLCEIIILLTLAGCSYKIIDNKNGIDYK